MTRFYIEPKDIKGSKIYITKEEAHHILDVMRLKKGDHIVTFDGKGKEYEGVIRDIRKSGVMMEVRDIKAVKVVEKVNLTLAQAIPKKAKIDFIIEKSTELGVDAIIPMHSFRTIVKFNKKKEESRHKRWQKIAVSASKQCGRLKIPAIYPLTEFVDVIKKVKDYDLALMACLHKETQNLKDTIANFRGRRLVVFIGPEGDFTAEEAEVAREGGCKLVSLGPRVLKVDTAAINILSILRYELG